MSANQSIMTEKERKKTKNGKKKRKEKGQTLEIPNDRKRKNCKKKNKLWRPQISANAVISGVSAGGVWTKHHFKAY